MSASSLTVSLLATLTANLKSVNQLGNNQAITTGLQFTTSAGTAADQADQIFVYQQTNLAASGTVSISMHDFGGALDVNGQALALVRVKFVLVQILGKINTAPAAPTFTDADSLTVGGDGTTASWTSFLPTNATNLPPMYSGTASNPGTIQFQTGGAGWTVGASTTNKLLKFTNNGSNALSFNLIVVGATA